MSVCICLIFGQPSASFSCSVAITVATDPAFFGDDPFARVFPGTVVETELFAPVAPPGGPAIERYRGIAWPGGRFDV